MRTTITLDDDLFAKLKQASNDRGVPFKRVVNEALRAGLARPLPARRPFRQETFSMGGSAVDLTKANRLAAELENEEFMRKLRAGR